MKNFSYYLSHFLKEYLVVERNVSSKTIRSYKTTFQILITYLVEEKNMKLIDITFENVTKEMILDFLNYLEEEKKEFYSNKKSKISSYSFFLPVLFSRGNRTYRKYSKNLSIKTKKYEKKVQEYLTKEEVQTLLARIEPSNKIGRRNLLVLSLLYDTAARAEEIFIKIRRYSTRRTVSDLNRQRKQTKNCTNYGKYKEVNYFILKGK